MPVMLPPGQGTTVTLPGQSAQAVVPGGQGADPQGRLAAPPSPFRQAHGPDVLILPHTQEAEQAQQPAQMRRPGKLLQLARRALKLNRPLTRDDLEPWTNRFAANPQDDAPHLVFADFLAEHGDPREEIVRQQVARGRQGFGEKRFLWPETGAPFSNLGVPGYTEAFSHGLPVISPTEALGYVYMVPHTTEPKVLVSWKPQGYREHASDSYQGVVSPDHAHDIARRAGIHPEQFQDWPDHAKPKIIADPT